MVWKVLLVWTLNSEMLIGKRVSGAMSAAMDTVQFLPALVLFGRRRCGLFRLVSG
jgi:hypothetical protein